MNNRLLIVALVTVLAACSGKPVSHPESSASYAYVDSEVGCKSTYSSDKKDDIFKNRYRDHWMTWSGTVALSSASDASLNIDGKGIQDLAVDFADKNAGYDLQEGSRITVRFLMKHEGGCFLPFSGEEATIVG